MVHNMLPYKVGNLSIDKYIKFYKKVPEYMWSKKPIFYFRKGKWDALGLLGESPHKFNVPSKTLSMYFKETLGFMAVRVCDNDIPKYQNILCPKKRFIAALEDIKKESSETKLLRIFNKAKDIYNERYY